MKRNVKRHAVVQPLDPSYRIIPLTKGYNTNVDVSDYTHLMEWNWCALVGKDKRVIYAVRVERCGKKTKKILLHKVLFPQWMEIDHKDGDGLNNRRSNLRESTHSQNLANRPINSNNTSGFKGVHFHVRDNYWFSVIGINGEQKWLGRCTDAIDAARKYDLAALDAFGEFAITNFPVSDYSKSDIENRFTPSGKWSKNTSGYKGVSWNKKANKWAAEGRHKGERSYLGMFPPTEEGKIEAAHTYDRWVIQHRCPTAYTNFPRDSYE